MIRLDSAIAAAAACALLAVGCSKSSSSGATAVERGEAIFTENCASCHGVGGAGGGIGPVLKGEKNRKNEAAAIAWIENPVVPMPKLYPGTLSEQDVRDVAAYVETL